MRERERAQIEGFEWYITRSVVFELVASFIRSLSLILCMYSYIYVYVDRNGRAIEILHFLQIKSNRVFLHDDFLLFSIYAFSLL